MNASLRTLVVGCGAAAQQLYRRPLRKLENQQILRVTGLVDPSQRHAQAMQRLFPSAAIHQSLGNALRSDDVELALILSPSQMHADQTIQVLEAGGHVLCEKPLAATQLDCARIQAAVKQTGGIVGVAMVRRFFPAFAQLHEMLSQQTAPPIEFEYTEGRRFEWGVTTAAAFRPSTNGGSGVLLDIGPHMLDALTWFFGPLTVTGCGDDAFAGGVESNVTIDLQTKACSGTARISWDQPLRNELRVRGRDYETVLRVDQFDQLAIRRDANFQPVFCQQRFPLDLSQPANRYLTPRIYSQAILCQLVQMVRAVVLGESPAVSIDEASLCVDAIEAARGLAQPIEMGWLASEQQSAFNLHHRANT